MLDFLSLRFTDILDIIVIAIILFYAFRLLRGTHTFKIVLVIMALFGARMLCMLFDMKMTSGLIGAFLDVGLIALIVICQPEIRRFLAGVGNNHSKTNALWRLFSTTNEALDNSVVEEICQACDIMSEEKCGALIVIQHNTSLQDVVNTGDIIDAQVSQILLRNIFFKNSPLHDGAAIIASGRVVAARCTLPMSTQNLPAHFGMRHRAATGLSEQSDATVIVVSEETGRISVAQHNKLNTIRDANELRRILRNG